MKKSLFAISFVISSVLAIGQLPNTQFISNSSTKLEIRGPVVADSGYIIPNFADTATANLGSYIKGIPGILIRTGNIIWIRNATASAWIQLASTSFYTFSNLLTQSPAGTVKLGGIATGTTSLNLSGNRFAIDSGKVIINTSLVSPQDSSFSILRGVQRIFNVSATNAYTTVDNIQTSNGGFFTTGISAVFNNYVLQLNNGSLIEGFQNKINNFRSYPMTLDSMGILVTNDTLGANGRDSSFYFPFQIKFTSFVDNLTRTKFSINGAGKLAFAQVITPGGTTGDQTINAPTGTVNIAAAGTSVTVTNSLVTTSSLIYAVVRTNDGTAAIKNVVPGSGSFVIHLSAAATAETSIGWIVFN